MVKQQGLGKYNEPFTRRSHNEWLLQVEKALQSKGNSRGVKKRTKSRFCLIQGKKRNNDIKGKALFFLLIKHIYKFAFNYSNCHI